MCVVSMVMDYGREGTARPVQQWPLPAVEDFQKLVKAAEKFDESAGEPDCIDPEKEKFMKELEERVKVLEEKSEV